MTSTFDQLCINTIRMLSADAVEKARSGHPGMPMGSAPMAYALWTRILKHNPSNPLWPDRDRFILSAGHGSMLLYTLLYLTGYEISVEDLKQFRQWESKTPGHPEYSPLHGIETTTGPLGQGFANGVGMAIAEQYLASHFNRPGLKIVDHYIYGIVSDGDLMEGISHEAASLAGHLGLGKLIYLYDDNRISIEGSTNLSFTEDRGGRFKAYGWHVETVLDGNDPDLIERTLRNAQEETSRPSLIMVRTHIGFGSPHKQDSADAHGEPLGLEEIRLTKQNLGWPVDPAFFVPEEALGHFRKAVNRGNDAEKAWQDLFRSYEKAYPDLAKEFIRWMGGELPKGWEEDIPLFPPDPIGIATRNASGTVLNAISQKVPNLIGGSADLAPSNKTLIKGSPDFQNGAGHGRNIRFGVREHGMAGILNGMALHGGVIPYGGTFLIFSDYMRPSIRLAALMGIKVIYVFTHDSIGLGEDGPTHQPIEQLAALRAIPKLLVIRPCDANETSVAWKTALNHTGGPVALVLTRQNLPVLERIHLGPAADLARGAYILDEPESGRPDVILLASGSEVHIAREAMSILKTRGIHARVVNMPCWELFESQPREYRDRVLPAEIKARLAVEAGSPLGWHHYVGDRGDVLGIDRFGASAPYKILYENFGLTPQRVVEKALSLLER